MLLLIIAINLAFFLRTLRLNFVSDDLSIYHTQPPPKNKWQKRWQQFLGERRINPPQDHLMTMLIHTASCCLIYLAFGRNHLSFLTAVLFSLNPANNQVTIWISGRGYALLTMGLTGAMAFPILAPVFLFTTIWWSMGFLAPLVFIGSKFTWFFYFIPLLWLYHGRKFKKAIDTKLAHETADEDRRFHLRKIVVAIKTMGFYLTLAIYPFRLTFYHSYMQSMAGNDISMRKAYTMKDKFFFIGLAAIGYLTYSFFHWTPAAWGMWWFCIGIAPYCNLMRRNQETAERYIYMPNVGLMFFLANMIINYPIAITAFITLYAVRFYFFYRVAYVDDYWLIESAVQEDTAAWFAWHMRAHKRFSQGALREAINMWVMAKLMSPHEFKILFNIGSILTAIGHKKEGLEYLDLAEKHIVKGQEEQAKEVLAAAREGRVPVNYERYTHPRAYPPGNHH